MARCLIVHRGNFNINLNYYSKIFNYIYIYLDFVMISLENDLLGA
jgi:hypothetical protein